MSTLCVLGVRPDDVAHQPVAHDVPVSQIAEPDPFDPGEDPLDLEQSGILSVGQVDLRLVSRDHRARVHAQAREEHLHLHASRVLSLIENHEGVGQGATTHVREWRDLDGAVVDRDRKSTRLNSSHGYISYAVFCLKKKKKKRNKSDQHET